jgi:hypothetical protein
MRARITGTARRSRPTCEGCVGCGPEGWTVLCYGPSDVFNGAAQIVAEVERVLTGR